MKSIVCDFDGTLVKYKKVDKVRSDNIRITLLGIIIWFPFLQRKLGRKSSIYNKLKDLNYELFIVSARPKFKKNSHGIIRELIERDIPDENIYLRNSRNRFKHKARAIRKIQERTEILVIIEDEPKIRSYLKQQFPEIPVIAPDAEELKRIL